MLSNNQKPEETLIEASKSLRPTVVKQNVMEPVMHKILHIVPQFQPGDGISSVVMNYAKAIDHARFTFDIITHRVDHPSYVNAIQNMGGTVHVLEGFSFGSLSRLRHWVNDFYTRHQEEYDAVHCHMSNAAFLYLREAARVNVPVRILHSHQTKYADTFSHAIRNMPLIAWGRKYANVNVACSRQAGRFLFGNQPFIPLPNAIDTQRFTFNQHDRDEYRENMRLTKDDLLYGNVGRLALQKNQGFLLQAFRDVRQHNPNAHLIIIGEGPLRTELHQMAQDIGIKDAVIWVDNTSRIDAYYSAMDAFLLPSLHEGLPVSLIEAQCSGLPCLIAQNIDDQSIILPTIHQLPIDDKSLWSRQMFPMKSSPAHNRLQASHLVSQAGFDMRVQARLLEDIYLSRGFSSKA